MQCYELPTPQPEGRSVTALWVIRSCARVGTVLLMHVPCSILAQLSCEYLDRDSSSPAGLCIKCSSPCCTDQWDADTVTLHSVRLCQVKETLIDCRTNAALAARHRRCDCGAPDKVGWATDSVPTLLQVGREINSRRRMETCRNLIAQRCLVCSGSRIA